MTMKLSTFVLKLNKWICFGKYSFELDAVMFQIRLSLQGQKRKKKTQGKKGKKREIVICSRAKKKGEKFYLIVVHQISAHFIYFWQLAKIKLDF